MGAHHFKLEFVAREVAENCHDIELVVDQGQALGKVELPNEALTQLRRILPVDTSWGETEEYRSANEWGSDLRIWHEEKSIQSIQLRYSPFSDSFEVLEEFIHIASEFDFLVFSVGSKSVFEPILSIFLNELSFSNASLFCKDPGQALVNAAKKTKND